MSSAKKIAIQPLQKMPSALEVVRCPPDKSLTHRAIILAGMARGESIIHRPLLGEDCLATLRLMTALGVSCQQSQDEHDAILAITSPGLDAWRSPIYPVDCANSGTTARLATGILAGVRGLFVCLYGDKSLSARPMERVVTPLRRLGASVFGRDDGRYLPLAIQGRALTHGDIFFEKASAQVKSAILLAGTMIDGVTTIQLPRGSRDHTEKLLAKLGADCGSEQIGENEHAYIRGPFRPQELRAAIPGDPSSAAFICAMVGLQPGRRISIDDVLDNPTRTACFSVMRRMGIKIDKMPYACKRATIEPAVSIIVEGANTLAPVSIPEGDVACIIDEIPILAALALFAEGESEFRGLSELRIKESNRLAKTAELLTLAGGKVRVEEDVLIVYGGLKKIRAFTFNPGGDHRLAMTAAILARFGDDRSILEQPDCVDVSFPGFFAQLEVW